MLIWLEHTSPLTSLFVPIISKISYIQSYGSVSMIIDNPFILSCREEYEIIQG
jgi:hypothetical protein